jgi:hypothetical protein
MWLYVSGGFLSIVAHRDKPEHLLVRARHPDHIGALLPGLEPTVLETADYRFRVVADRTVVVKAITHYLTSMDYDNFKASIIDKDYHDVCLDVWKTMWAYGCREEGY